MAEIQPQNHPVKKAQTPTDVRQVMPWDVTDLSLRPFPGMWSFNPSIHFDGETWRCSLRCADYAMPDGNVIRGNRASPTQTVTRNVMIELDPDTWQHTAIYEIEEHDNHPRVANCPNVGFEDLRLFMTDTFGLQAIAASLHLDVGHESRTRRSSIDRSIRRPPRKDAGEAHPAEQVILSFDDEYNIADVFPIRGNWNAKPQKNWSPFDRAHDPRFLYSIERGVVFSHEGPLTPLGPQFGGDRERQAAARRASGGAPIDHMAIIRGKTTRMDAGRAAPLRFEGIRGGTQLVHIGDALESLVGPVEQGAWLGIGHEMRFVKSKKYYWHVFYVVDSAGKTLVKSQPVKLAENGIEFAAGLAVDDDRAMISFGVDDAECKLAETSLSAIFELLAQGEGDFADEREAYPPQNVTLTRMMPSAIRRSPAGQPNGAQPADPADIDPESTPEIRGQPGDPLGS
jgi:hypothetical protein